MRHQSDRSVIRAAASVALFLAALAAGWSPPAAAGDPIATLRNAEIGIQPDAPRMPKVVDRGLRRARNYPEQPPTIPHKVRDYQIDLYSNKCLSCHSRRGAEQAQAPMVSVTHFMDREGQVRASVSPRRYFCNQCHVPQTEIKALIGNDFLDVDQVLKGLKGK